MSSHETLPEGLVLGLAGSVDKKSAEQPRARPGSRTESSIPADGAGNSADTGARGGAAGD